VSAIPSHRGDSEVVADLVAPARGAKAANTPVAAVLGSDPHHAGGQWMILHSAREAEAESEVVALFGDAGFFVADLGGLRDGGQMQQVGAELARERWSCSSYTRTWRERARRSDSELWKSSHTSDDFLSIPNPPSNGGNRQ
jgi:predicted dinucleotide-binding enzyme